MNAQTIVELYVPSLIEMCRFLAIIDNKQNSNELMPQAQLLSTNVIEGADNDKPHPNETTLQSPEKVIPPCAYHLLGA